MNGEHERWYPATTGETFEALRKVIYRTHGIKSRDDFGMAVTFDTRPSGFSSGQNVTATVMPRDGGAVVTVRGVGKVRTNVGNPNALAKAADELLGAISAEIQSARQAPA